MNFNNLVLLFRCNKEYRHQKLKTTVIGESECMICSYVIENNSCTQDDVSRGLKLDKTTVAKAIKRLEAKGCIKREKDKTDSRKNRLSITEKGKENTQEIISLHDKWYDSISYVLTKKEQADFEIYLLKLLSAANKHLEEQSEQNI